MFLLFLVSCVGAFSHSEPTFSIRDCKSALNELKDHPLQGGYSTDLDNLLVTLDISEALEEHTYVPQVQSYIEKKS